MTQKLVLITLALSSLTLNISAQQRPPPKACTKQEDCHFGAICLSVPRNPDKKFCECPRKCHNFSQNMVFSGGLQNFLIRSRLNACF